MEIEIGDGPIVAAAIHDGHDLSPDIESLMGISEDQRLREEDPFTGNWTRVANSRVLGTRSRFEVDLNRPIDLAVYRDPNFAWGLKVYSESPSPEQTKRTLINYYRFYTDVSALIQKKIQQYGRVIVLDRHSYNHRRSDPSSRPADPAENPEVNIGTGTLLDRSRWSSVINQFVFDLRSFDFNGRNLDVRENIKFFGGNMAERIHKTFGDSVLVLSVEFKKFFMDEWTGQPFPEKIDLIENALRSTIPNLEQALISRPK